jgi:hypothetical protein
MGRTASVNDSASNAAIRNRSLGKLGLVLVTHVLLGGCTVNPRMVLSSSPQLLRDGARWWAIGFDGGNRDPIVGVELLKNGQPHQLLMSDRGARLYRYQKRRLVDWGPPLPALPADEHLGDVRLGLRLVLRDSVIRADPRTLEAEIQNVQDMRGVVALMETHWPDRRVAEPALSPAQLDLELSNIPLGLSPLMKLAF